MSSWVRRAAGASAVVAAALLAVPVACSAPGDVCDPMTGVCARNEMVGKVGQECFPGDFCDPGLTCLPRAIPSDGASLGTDGGECFCLSELCAPHAEDAGADAPDQ